MTTPKIKCSQCKGTGVTALSGSLLETLQIVQRSKRGMLMREIYNKTSDREFITITAVNQRVHDLHLANLVHRRREGKAFRWFGGSK